MGKDKPIQYIQWRYTPPDSPIELPITGDPRPNIETRKYSITVPGRVHLDITLNDEQLRQLLDGEVITLTDEQQASVARQLEAKDGE